MNVNHNGKGRRRKARIACHACRGKGRVEVPNLEGVSLSQIARTAGLSRSLVSRMLSDNVAEAQKRLNPELDTMIRVCESVKTLTGTPLSLDALARAIRS
jgi:transcriptional regulator with XRE-family HTH domain